MVGQQQYNQRCPLASGLDVIGSRWTLLIVRELVLGPRRFSEIRTELQGASSDMVTVRIKELVASGLLQRVPDRHYALTDAGYDLTGVIAAVNQWAFAHPDVVPVGTAIDRADMVRRLATLLSITARTSLPGGHAGHGDHLFGIGELRLSARPIVRGGYEFLECEDHDAPTATLSTSGLVQFVFETETSLDDLLEAGDLHIEQETARSLLALVRSVLPTMQQTSTPVA